MQNARAACCDRDPPQRRGGPKRTRILLPLRLSQAQIDLLPHLPAFWPERTVVPAVRGPVDALPARGPGSTEGAPLAYSPGPFRPARLGGREVPVLLVVGPAPDPVGAALAAPAPHRLPGAEVAAAMAAMVAGRIGAPPDLPDPGAAGAGLEPRQARILIDPCDPARAAAARAMLAGLRAAGLAVVVARDPFATGTPVLPGSLPGSGPPWDPWTLLEAAHTLHGASRDLALLALAAGVGVADGPLAGADPNVCWAALLASTRAADPFRNRPCSLAEGLDLLALWRMREAESRGIAACLGVHPYKRDRLRALLASAAPPPAFAGSARRAIAQARHRGGAVLAWSAGAPPALAAACAGAGVPLRWLEDGFIRSAGLGAAFRAGASFALDASGPYYDPGRQSDLARLLAEAEFPPALLARAAALRRAVVARGVTKYNLGGAPPEIAAPPGRRRILVPGQVEDDASIRLGAGAIRRNLDLLRAVRAAEPDAFLIYKPHPDIEAGFRRGRIAGADLASLADQVLRQAPMAPLFGLVDAVHTITSLTGFEALLRGLPVTCWGTPFYAGWGLTTDHGPPATPPRRRRLVLDELVAAALILYPRCIDPLTGLPCPPEILLDRMDRPDLFPTGRRARLRAVQGFVTRALSRLRGWR
jgi:capsular polysaccharide export protein